MKMEMRVEIRSKILVIPFQFWEDGSPSTWPKLPHISARDRVIHE